MVLLVRPEVLGELVDPDSEEGDLRLRRAGVGLVPAVLLEHVELRFLGEAHATSESTLPVLPARRARKDANGREQGSRKGSRARRAGSGAEGAGTWRRRRGVTPDASPRESRRRRGRSARSAPPRCRRPARRAAAATAR